MRSRKALKPKNKIKDPRPRDYRSYGTFREGEARNALTMLGLDWKAFTFLGFPDEGLCLLASKDPVGQEARVRIALHRSIQPAADRADDSRRSIPAIR